MKLSKQFTRREKILLVILAFLLLFAVYFLAVHLPVTETLADVQAQKEDISTNLMVLEAQQQRMEQMQAELDEIMSQPNVAEIPKYDNLQRVMDFLNTVLRSTDEYTLSFQGLQQPEEGDILRRTIQMTFSCSSYAGARSVIEQLQNCSYRCQISDFSMVPFVPEGQTQNDDAALLDSAVQVSLIITFYESLR